jgi:hypothetical protein
LKLTEWVKEHIDELDKDVEDLRHNPSPAEEEIENETELEDLNFD